VLKGKKQKNLSRPRILYPAKILFKNEGKINTFFPGKQNLRDRHVPKQANKQTKNLKGNFQVEIK